MASFPDLLRCLKKFVSVFGSINSGNAFPNYASIVSVRSSNVSIIPLALRMSMGMVDHLSVLARLHPFILPKN